MSQNMTRIHLLGYPSGGFLLYVILQYKRTGEYFAHTTGAGNQALSSIHPMTYEQARSWAEKELPEEQVSHIFAEPTDGEKVQLGIRVSAASAARLQRVALDRGISQAELLDKWIQNGT